MFQETKDGRKDGRVADAHEKSADPQANRPAFAEWKDDEVRDHDERRVDGYVHLWANQVNVKDG